MGDWVPHRYARSPSLVRLLGEYSSKETEARSSNSEGGSKTLISPASRVDDRMTVKKTAKPAWTACDSVTREAEAGE